jgi:hypothetical protein
MLIVYDTLSTRVYSMYRITVLSLVAKPLPFELVTLCSQISSETLNGAIAIG